MTRTCTTYTLLLRIGIALSVALALIGPELTSPRPAAAALAAPIDPALQQQMQANPLKQLPVILEMEHVPAPLSGANAQLAQQALSLLQLNGQGQAALPLLAS